MEREFEPAPMDAAGVAPTVGDRAAAILARITELDAERSRLWAEYEAHEDGVKEGGK